MRYFIFCLAVVSGGLSFPSFGETLAQMAKQQNCTSAPIMVEGTDLYKCKTSTAMSYFSGPSSGAAARKNTSGSRTPTPANFPRVDGTMQRERDDVRKRVLTEELATEVRMQAESQSSLAAGSTPLPDETVTSPKYLDRLAKLRQTIDNHSRNIQALNKELDRLR